MRVTRITIDADLGLIELRTGPGGDGDYVLLPIQLEDAMKRYVDFAGEHCISAPEESPAGPTLTKGDDGVFRAGTPIQLFDNDGTPNGTLVMPPGTLVAPGGWSVPKDQAYDFNTGNGVEYVRSPEFQKDFDAFLAANDDMRPATTFPIKPKEECDGNCGAHPVKKGRKDDVWTKAPTEDEPSKERHTGPATITNPIRVFAEEHSRGYKLTTPAIPGWRETVNQYDLYKVPDMVRDTLEDMGTELAANYPVSITVIEEEQ